MASGAWLGMARDLYLYMKRLRLWKNKVEQMGH